MNCLKFHRSPTGRHRIVDNGNSNETFKPADASADPYRHIQRNAFQSRVSIFLLLLFRLSSDYLGSASLVLNLHSSRLPTSRTRTSTALISFSIVFISFFRFSSFSFPFNVNFHNKSVRLRCLSPHHMSKSSQSIFSRLIHSRRCTSTTSLIFVNYSIFSSLSTQPSKHSHYRNTPTLLSTTSNLT